MRTVADCTKGGKLGGLGLGGFRGGKNSRLEMNVFVGRY